MHSESERRPRDVTFDPLAARRSGQEALDHFGRILVGEPFGEAVALVAQSPEVEPGDWAWRGLAAIGLLDHRSVDTASI